LERIVKKLFLYIGIAGLWALLFSACPTEAEEEESSIPDPVISLTGGKGELELIRPDGEIYLLDFATGTEVKSRRSPDWDIAFYPTRQIWTNSGYTAEQERSRGDGAVWHTEKTDFEAVTLEDAVKDDPVYGKYNTDVLRYAFGMAGYDFQPERNMNVMTYLGYPNERDNPLQDGTTAANLFQPFYLYDKRAYYEATVGKMPPDFRVTNRVYIIRHGDGVHHSKFQVTKFERDSQDYIDTYGVRWENLD
jgi:hypothetical protein